MKFLWFWVSEAFWCALLGKLGIVIGSTHCRMGHFLTGSNGTIIIVDWALG
jgi:hypothetical protein